MLHKVSELQGDAILAKDGEIGALAAVYFDDERWGVRYFVVDTEDSLARRKVLISPASIERGEWPRDAIRVGLTREQVSRCPDIDEHKPVSRQYEMAHARHFGYPYYWVGPELWGQAPVPMSIAAAREQGALPVREMQELAAEGREQDDSHLRSSAEVIGYAIEAADGSIGHVEDLLIDDETWSVADLVVEARSWLPGKQVLVPPDAIEDIDWLGKRVRLRLTRDQIKGARRQAYRIRPGRKRAMEG